MYTIGVFSSMNKITTKTLRHYDKIGLLKPELVDNDSGYRYYSSDQFLTLYKIKMLQQMGFELKEIAGLMSNPNELKTSLQTRRESLIQHIREEEQRLLLLNNQLLNMTQGDTAPYNYMIKPLPSVLVACMDRTMKNHDDYFTIYPEMGKYMSKQHLKCASPPYCFTRYLDGEYKTENIRVEICESVISPGKDTEHLKFKNLPGTDMAFCILHHGPYHTMDLPYNWAYHWLSNHGYEACDLPRESYIDGIWNKEHEEEWLTEIQIPIQLATKDH